MLLTTPEETPGTSNDSDGLPLEVPEGTSSDADIEPDPPVCEIPGPEALAEAVRDTLEVAPFEAEYEVRTEVTPD